MPVIDYSNPDLWWIAYKLKVNRRELAGHPLWGQYIRYSREFAKLMSKPEEDDISFFLSFWDGLTSDPEGYGYSVTIPTDAKVAIIGAGFGFLAEAAVRRGWTDVWALDPSDYIDARKNDLAWRKSGETWVQDEVTAQVPIIKHGTGSNVNQVRAAIGGNPDWIITDDMISSLKHPNRDPSDPDELTPALQWLDSLVATGGTVLHRTTIKEFGGPPFHTPTLAEWKSFYPTHLFCPPVYPSRHWEIL